MNRIVADPHWGGFIVWYFFLGGIAAGAYAFACMAALFGGEDDRRVTRAGHYTAFPLVAICGLLLTIDLGRPERFWHMLIQSNTFRPMFKWWSPMSIGSWCLTLFGACSFLSFASAVGAARKGGDEGTKPGLFAKLVALVGGGLAFFLGSYTGVLLTASNQPIWADTPWLGALFLTSSASTGAAVLVIAAVWRHPDDARAIARLERIDTWAIVLECVMLGLTAHSLGRAATLEAIGVWPGVLLPAVVVPLGLAAPLLLNLAFGLRTVNIASILAIIGGFALRAAVVGLPARLLSGVH